MIFHQKKYNMRHGLGYSLCLFALAYYVCIYKGDNIIDYIVGAIGIVIFGGAFILVLFKFIFGYQPRTIELKIDENGIQHEGKINWSVSWNDVSAIGIVYLYRGMIHILSITLKDEAKYLIVNKYKSKWSYFMDKGIGGGDINMYFNIYEPNIECAIKEVHKYFYGTILEPKYIL